MITTTYSPLAQQGQTDPDRTVSHDPGGHREPRTRGATTHWISLAHTTLNQAKMASPRRPSAPSRSSVPCCS